MKIAKWLKDWRGDCIGIAIMVAVFLLGFGAAHLVMSP